MYKCDMTVYKKVFLLVVAVAALVAVVFLTARAVGGNLDEADQMASVVGAVASVAALVVSVWQFLPTQAQSVTARDDGVAAGRDATTLSGARNKVRIRRGGTSAGGPIRARGRGAAAGGRVIVVTGDENEVT
jgi:hypothetical protein